MQRITIDSYIFDPLIRDFVGHERRPAALLVYLYLWMETKGKGRAQVQISLRELADATGFSKSSLQTSMATLKRRKLVTAFLATPTSIPVFRVETPWRR